MQRELDRHTGHALVPVRRHADVGVLFATAGMATNLATLLTGQYARYPGAAVVTLVIGSAFSSLGGAMVARSQMGGPGQPDHS